MFESNSKTHIIQQSLMFGRLAVMWRTPIQRSYICIKIELQFNLGNDRLQCWIGICIERSHCGNRCASRSKIPSMDNLLSSPSNKSNLASEKWSITMLDPRFLSTLFSNRAFVSNTSGFLQFNLGNDLLNNKDIKF